jgi:3-deoxy-7-phosphoheptulonate synthase
MIIVMRGDVTPESDAVQEVVRAATRYQGVETQVRTIEGATRSLTEVYLLGSTATVPREPFEEMAGVERVIRIRAKYRAIGRHEGEAVEVGFAYNGVQFGQDTFHLMPGLCAVDSRASVRTFRCLSESGSDDSRGR